MGALGDKADSLPAAPKAYSYKRFSTPEQGEGDSLRRQTVAAENWAAKHGVELDTTLKLTDAGISAFSGANLDNGALGAFKKAVEAGEVPTGSWLLVESLDRLSRDDPWDAIYTMQGIVRAGITVVDLSDGEREYSQETLRGDPTPLIVMVMVFMRANNESVIKAARVAGAFENKRRRFASQETMEKPYTRRLPAWIRWDQTSKDYALIPERAELVRKMFELTIEGWGQHRIARWLNDTGVETWGAGKWKAAYWHRTYIRKILTNRATVGTFIPHRVTRARTGGRKKVRTPLEAIHHRLPPAIDGELFTRVADQLATKGARGRNAGRAARSIFAGVIKCEHCGGTVTRVTKGRHVYLVCAAANAGGGTCKYESVPYQEAEDALRGNIPHTIEHAPRGQDTTEVQSDIERQVAEVAVATHRVRELLNIAITDKSKAAKLQLGEAERELEKSESRLQQLQDKRDKMTTVNVATRLRAVEDVLARSDVSVEETNRVLRQAIRMMVMKPAEGTLLIHWHHAEKPQEVVFHTRRFNWNGQGPWSGQEGGQRT